MDVVSNTSATTIQILKIGIMETKEYFITLGLCILFFLGIPIKIHNNFTKNDKDLFRDFVQKYNKSYVDNDTEYLIRFKYFMNSLRLIEELNKNQTNNQSALYGITIFSDLSQEEFYNSRLQKNNLKWSGEQSKYLVKFTSGRNFQARTKRSLSIPERVDWREKGIIGSIHNQKTCGACWAFSTIETAESMNALKVGSLIDLSVQEVIDCAKYGNYGCEGGDSCSLLNWLVATKTKITTNKLYPFIYKTGICRVKKPKTGVQIKNFSCNNFANEEDLLQKEIAFHGPVAAAVNAINWQYYLGGIIQYHCTGDIHDLNHAVQIVGYDKTGPVPFYIVRNSWGIEFGDKGYVYIAIGQNLCGLANEVTSLDVL